MPTTSVCSMLQGYVVYQVKETLKQEYQNLSSNEIRYLKLSGVQLVYSQITDTVTHPEIAFTGDTMSDFVLDESNIDVLKANILVMEGCSGACTRIWTHSFVRDNLACKQISVQGNSYDSFLSSLHCRGKMYLIHQEIQEALWKLEAPLAGRVSALLEGICVFGKT
ncbi:tRNase Z TRZ1 [Linum perenne]